MKKELKTDLERIAYNCRKATFLIEKKQGDKLTSQEKLELQIHLAGCYICRVYEQQSLLISDMLRNLFSSKNLTETKLGDNYKNHLKKIITTELNKN